jgi:hypothetical protein
MAERPAIFRTRRISTIYKIQIEKRGDWHTGATAFDCHHEYCQIDEKNTILYDQRYK